MTAITLKTKLHSSIYVSWPSFSPDLNPLDFWFLGYCMQENKGNILKICNRYAQL